MQFQCHAMIHGMIRSHGIRHLPTKTHHPVKLCTCRKRFGSPAAPRRRRTGLASAKVEGRIPFRAQQNKPDESNPTGHVFFGQTKFIFVVWRTPRKNENLLKQHMHTKYCQTPTVQHEQCGTSRNVTTYCGTRIERREGEARVAHLVQYPSALDLKEINEQNRKKLTNIKTLRGGIILTILPREAGKPPES